MNKVWAIYARRSMVRLGDANVSIETQREAALRRVPPGATVVEFIDADPGHHSGGDTSGRPAYVQMVEALEEGRLAGIAAYDDSRLNRAAEVSIALFKRCAVLGVLLRTDDSVFTVEQMGDDSGGHQTLFGIRSVMSDAERAKMRKRVRDLARNTWADGGIWATTPFGYRTVRDPGTGKVLRNGLARRLELMPEQAEVVRRVFDLLREHSHAGVAAILNREGAKHGRPGPWTHNTVKDLWRRREFYAGKVTRKRGLESVDGKHEPVLSKEAHRDAEIAVRNRQSKKGRRHPNAKRVYLLSGIAYCDECGHRLRGVTQSSRGAEWRYYNCPVNEHRSFVVDDDGNLIECTQKRVRAGEAEAAVLDALEARRLPPEAWDEAEAELRRRLTQPAEGTSDKERQHLTRRLEALRKQHEWGDITDTEYRTGTAAVRSDLAALPSETGKIVEFRQKRRVAASLPDALAALGAEGRHAEVQDALSGLVARVVVRDRRVVRIEPVAAARPFFRAADEDGLISVAPPDGLEPPTPALGRLRSVH
jgi:DNA invertase Pin-like site-specific DNA recombinase